MPDLSLPDLSGFVYSPVLQQLLIGALALMLGLLVMTVAARIEVTSGTRAGQALRAYTTDTVDTPLEQLGAWFVKRVPAVRDLLGLTMHRRWLALEAPPWSTAGTVGLAVVLAAAGLLLALLASKPVLLLAPVIGFLLPFVRQRSAAEKVKRRTQSNLPDLSAMLAAEMAAGNSPDLAVERAAELGGPLARFLKLAMEEQRTTARPLFSRDKVPGLLPEVARRYDLPALRAFVAQIDLAAKTGAAGPELMSGLAHSLIIEYKDRSLREAEALDSRLAVPSVGFFFMPFMFLILVPLLLPVLNVL